MDIENYLNEITKLENQVDDIEKITEELDQYSKALGNFYFVYTKIKYKYEKKK